MINLTPGADQDASRADVLLSDGGIATIRSVAAQDEEQLLLLNLHSSDRTLHRRFFSLNREVADGYARRLARGASADALGLIAEIDGSVIAVAACERVAADTAEVAFLVDDDHQGRGLGTLLLGHLAARARVAGINRFTAFTSVANTPMIRVFRDTGFEVRQSTSGGVVEVSMSTDATEQAVAAADARARVAAVRSLRRLLYPQVVAVAGAGRRPGGVGRSVLENIRAAGFTGSLYAVHPQAAQIGEVAAYRTVAAIPAEVDLLVVAVPADQVVPVIAEAAAAGARGAVVLTAGLGEVGASGSDPPARDGPGRPPPWHADHRAELPRRAQPRSRDPPRCDVRCGDAATWPAGDRVPVRRGGDRACLTRPPVLVSGSPASCRWEQGRCLGQRLGRDLDRG